MLVLASRLDCRGATLLHEPTGARVEGKGQGGGEAEHGRVNVAQQVNDAPREWGVEEANRDEVPHHEILPGATAVGGRVTAVGGRVTAMKGRVTCCGRAF